MAVNKSIKSSSSGFACRMGLGFDVHKFTRKRKNLILGGFRIPYPLGLNAVSDGDVILHAICDGILGAACLGDIGDYFPPQRRCFRGMNSRRIADFVLKKIEKAEHTHVCFCRNR